MISRVTTQLRLEFVHIVVDLTEGVQSQPAELSQWQWLF